ncbi:MAG: RagB/SusD family nutrient uptake outer membrane protein, partial [Cyclobacteriaceae bacterium]|nr:RagB/SusD family nutrient uptake outer membrane protein [Cyclobacteriaceae bacterium]
MKTFKIFIIVIGIVSITINSCNEKTIDLDPIGDTEASFFQNEAQMTMGVMAVYQKLNFFYQWGNDRILHRIWLLPSDDLTNPGGDGHEIFSSLNGSNWQLSEFFNFQYQLIARANTVLQKIEENGDFAYEEGSSAKDWHKGESLFLRSWSYFMLWNTYGTAPLVTERILSLDEAFPPSSTGTELLDQAVIDLGNAIDLLPEAWDASEAGRATKNSARGLLGKVLVFRGTVNKANEDFSAAISAINSITGVSLTPNFNDNFDAEKENNVESLFEFQANITATGNANPWVAGAGANDAFSVIGELNAFYGYFNNKGYGGIDRSYSATTSLKNAFEAGDPR